MLSASQITFKFPSEQLYCMSGALKEEFSADSLARKIAGEIVLSDNPGNAIQKWRNIFKIPQRQLADKMGVMPSVISDYESGRRKSPGVKLIQRTVTALLDLDKAQGSPVTKEFNSISPKEVLSDAVLDVRECTAPITLCDLANYVKGDIVVGESEHERKIRGYAIIDSLKAILELSPDEVARLCGMAAEKALVFTNATSGKTHLIAVKATNLRPCAVVFHAIGELDPLAKRIAEAEKIPVVISKIKTIDELMASLRSGCENK